MAQPTSISLIQTVTDTLRRLTRCDLIELYLDSDYTLPDSWTRKSLIKNLISPTKNKSFITIDQAVDHLYRYLYYLSDKPTTRRRLSAPTHFVRRRVDLLQRFVIKSFLRIDNLFERTCEFVERSEYTIRINKQIKQCLREVIDMLDYHNIYYKTVTKLLTDLIEHDAFFYVSAETVHVYKNQNSTNFPEIDDIKKDLVSAGLGGAPRRYFDLTYHVIVLSYLKNNFCSSHQFNLPDYGRYRIIDILASDFRMILQVADSKDDIQSMGELLPQETIERMCQLLS